MKQSWPCIAGVLSLAAAPLACIAADVNVDIGTIGGVPSPAFGGVETPGVWNGVSIPAGVTGVGPVSLVDTDGVARGVTLTVGDLVFPFGDVEGFPPPSSYYSPDAYALLHDQVHTGIQIPAPPYGGTFGFDGLEPGTYDVVIYTTPTAVLNVQTIVIVGDDQSTAQSVDGSFRMPLDELVEGVTHVVQRDVRVGADGTLRLAAYSTLQSDQSYVNGIQLLGPRGCSPADLAAPLGALDFSDVVAFLAAFAAGEPGADLAPPAGVFDFSDVVEFLSAFAEGCG